MRKIFGPKRENCQEGGESCIRRKLMTCTLKEIK